jgi:hypothetical protein
LVARACNPCYSRGRGQEDLRLALASNSWDPILKTAKTSSSGRAPAYQAWGKKKKKKRKEIEKNIRYFVMFKILEGYTLASVLLFTE